MNVLLLDPLHTLTETIEDLTCSLGDIRVTRGRDDGNRASGPDTFDLIVNASGAGSQVGFCRAILNWRLHPHTCLIPCWIAMARERFERLCLWPSLAVDRCQVQFDAGDFCDWLIEIGEWQQTRMHLYDTNTLDRHTPLELASSLALRKATGRLAVFDEDGNEGIFVFHEGWMTRAELKHLRGSEAFFEFLCWSRGGYLWESPSVDPPAPGACILDSLLREGLKMIEEANLLYPFVPDWSRPVQKTDSESALDDGASPFFAQQKELHDLIQGTVTLDQIIEDSPLSRPRTMKCLARWFSLGDITAVPDGKTTAPARLLIVDDSRLMRKAFYDLFSRDSRFHIVGTARDGLDALRMIEELEPDTLTMDMQMPRMDGLTALKYIMIRHPRPVVVVSAFTGETSRLTYESFKYGAVDVLTKPAQGELQLMEREAEELRERVAQAARVRIEAAQYIRRTGNRSALDSDAISETSFSRENRGTFDAAAVIACGVGGFPALMRLLFALNPHSNLPAVVVALAMNRNTVEALAFQLGRDCAANITTVPSFGVQLVPGVVFLGSHEQCMSFNEGVPASRIDIDGECTCSRPFDHLFSGAADAYGEKAVGIVLSGTGSDGVEGMKAVQQKGGRTWVLDPAACLKPDLPQRILDAGTGEVVRTPSELASRLMTAGRCRLDPIGNSRHLLVRSPEDAAREKAQGNPST